MDEKIIIYTFLSYTYVHDCSVYPRTAKLIWS